MKKNIKLTESQFKNVIESMSKVGLTTEQEENEIPIEGIESSDELEYDEIEEPNPLSVSGHFKEDELGQIPLDETDIDELFDYTEGSRRRFIGVIYYDALIPATDDIEYDKKIAMGILENERRKMMNAETFLDSNESVHFRDKLY